jgi:hypothetical protein
MIVLPGNNANKMRLPEATIASSELITIDGKRWLTAVHMELAAGLYSSLWGPMPLAFFPVPSRNTGCSICARTDTIIEFSGG